MWSWQHFSVPQRTSVIYLCKWDAGTHNFFRHKKFLRPRSISDTLPVVLICTLMAIVLSNIIELLKTKCLPSLLYGIEACPVNNSVIKSLEFVIKNAFRKIFATKSCDIANECVFMFNCSVYDMVLKRKSKFLNKLANNENTLCKMFQNNIQVELSELSALYCT